MRIESRYRYLISAKVRLVREFLRGGIDRLHGGVEFEPRTTHTDTAGPATSTCSGGGGHAR